MNAWKAVSLVFWLALAVALPALAIDSQLEPSDEDAVKGCLPLDELVLGGAALGSPDKPALRRLGTPLSVRTSFGEDDGGRYELRIYRYKHVDVEVVRGTIDRVVARTSAARGPGAITLGFDREGLIRALARKGITLSESLPDVLSVHGCDSAVSYSLVLTLTGVDSEVSAMELFSSRP
jgi:hypothetical protein